MKRTPSIVLRLSVLLGVTTLFLWLGAAAIAIYVLKDEMTETFDEALYQSALRLLPLRHSRSGKPDKQQGNNAAAPKVAKHDEDSLPSSLRPRDVCGRILV